MSSHGAMHGWSEVVSDDLNTFAYDANVAGSDALSPGE